MDGHSWTAPSLPTASPSVPQDRAGGSCGWIKRSQVSGSAGGAEAGLDPTLGAAVLVIPPRGLRETFIPCFRANPWAGGAQQGRPGPCATAGGLGSHSAPPSPSPPLQTLSALLAPSCPSNPFGTSSCSPCSASQPRICSQSPIATKSGVNWDHLTL